VTISHRQVGPLVSRVPYLGPWGNRTLSEEIRPGLLALGLKRTAGSLLNSALDLTKLPNPNPGADPSPSRAATVAEKGRDRRRG